MPIYNVSLSDERREWNRKYKEDKWFPDGLISFNEHFLVPFQIEITFWTRLRNALSPPSSWGCDTCDSSEASRAWSLPPAETQACLPLSDSPDEDEVRPTQPASRLNFFHFISVGRALCDQAVQFRFRTTDRSWGELATRRRGFQHHPLWIAPHASCSSCRRN